MISSLKWSSDVALGSLCRYIYLVRNIVTSRGRKVVVSVGNRTYHSVFCQFKYKNKKQNIYETKLLLLQKRHLRGKRSGARQQSPGRLRRRWCSYDLPSYRTPTMFLQRALIQKRGWLKAHSTSKMAQQLLSISSEDMLPQSMH